MQQKVDKAQSLLDDMNEEETHGFKLPSHSKQQQPPKSEKDPFAATDAYDDDFDYDIEEELPEDQDAQQSARQVETSGQGITVSQSLGVDPSVDSLALEDYDHVEPVERLM